MNHIALYLPWVKKIFWYLNLPFVGVSAIYALITHQNPLDSYLCCAAFFLCVPYLIIRTDELRDKSFNNFSEEFRQMNDDDLLKFSKQLKFMPLGQSGSVVRSAYTTELKRRFGHSRHIYE